MTLSCDIEQTNEKSHHVLRNTDNEKKVVESKSYWFRCNTHDRIINSSKADLEECMFSDREKSGANTEKGGEE